MRELCTNDAVAVPTHRPGGPPPCALVEQDYPRRVLLRERDKPGGLAPALIDQTVRMARDHDYHVIRRCTTSAPTKDAIHACRTSKIPNVQVPQGKIVLDDLYGFRDNAEAF